MWPLKSRAERIADEWAALSAIKSDDFGTTRVTALHDFVSRHRMETLPASPNLKIAKIVIGAAQALAETPGGFDLGSSVLVSVIENGRSRPVREAALAAYESLRRQPGLVEDAKRPSQRGEWKWSHPGQNS